MRKATTKANTTKANTTRAWPKRLAAARRLMQRPPMHRLFVLLLQPGLIGLVLFCVLGAGPAPATPLPQGGVVAQERRAAVVGAEILRRGGNAVDAAVATGFALAVTYPRAGNLGGGGFMVIRLADGRATTIDFREAAPAAATPGMFLKADGTADPEKSRHSPLGIGVPGSVAGLALAHRAYGSGKFSLAELIAPAIALARDGLPIEDDVADSFDEMRRRMERWPSSRRIFLERDGRPLAPGDRLVQADLAGTLEAIARQGPDGFYRGAVAERMAAAIQAAGGLITAADLAAYRAIERAPIAGRYRGYDLLSMPLPSSGGTLLVEMLNVLEGFPLAAYGAGSADAIHVMAETMKRAYADRAAWLGDQEASRAPAEGLTTKTYAERLRATIRLDRARPSDTIAAGTPPREGDNTTHYSVVDAAGNAVSTTTTLNFSYGLGFVAEGTGVLMNNELDDFAAAPGAPNAYGLLGGAANAPGPGKRPLSSMTPTIVLKNGRPVLITGSPGGSRIITAVLQVVVNTLDFGLDVGTAVARPRFHHQWMPDVLLMEPGFDPAVREALQARGHTVREAPLPTSANSIAATREGYDGAADPRSRGAAAVGP